MESDFNTREIIPPFQDGESVEIGSSSRFIYYKARRNGILHFIKSPAQEFAGDLITIESLRKEFLLGYGLNHPGFVRYFSFEDNKLYEEYIEGLTLRQMIERDDKRLYQKGFQENITRQILEALRYLHTKGILHLDLKPENIIISDIGNQIKILDLSCARSISINSTPGYTEGYEAPEQSSGKTNVSTDLYQVGLIIKELAQAAGQERKWRQFIEKATAYHPDNRFQSAEQAIKALPSPANFKKWIIIFLPILIIGGIISIIIGSADTGEPETINHPAVEKELEPEIYISNERDNKTAPNEKPSPEVKITSEEETEQILASKIDHKLDELYSKQVTPMYQRMMMDDEYKYRQDVSDQFMEAYSKELDNLIAYGNELKKEYPGYSSFIDEKIKTTFATKTSQMRNNLYPRRSASDLKPQEIVVYSSSPTE